MLSTFRMTFVFAICTLITIANAAPLPDKGIACGLIGMGLALLEYVTQLRPE